MSPGDSNTTYSQPRCTPHSICFTPSSPSLIYAFISAAQAAATVSTTSAHNVLFLLDIPTLCLHDQIRNSNGCILLLCRFPAYSLPFVPSYHRTALHKPLQTLRNCDSVPFLLAVWENQPAKTSSPFTYTTPSTSSNTASTPTPVCTATKLN